MHLSTTLRSATFAVLMAGLAAAGGCGTSGEAPRDATATVDATGADASTSQDGQMPPDAAMGDGGAVTLLPVSMRVVSACGQDVDVYVGDGDSPFATVRGNDGTDYVQVMMPSSGAVVEVRTQGAPHLLRPLAASPPFDAASSSGATPQRFTVILDYRGCTPRVLWENFSASASNGMLRARFVDFPPPAASTAGQPTRLWQAGTDGIFRQLVATTAQGDSGPEGFTFPVPDASGPPVRLVVSTTAPTQLGRPGFEIPASAFHGMQKLFLLYQGPFLLLLDENGPTALLGAAVAGQVLGNTTVVLANAIADLCGFPTFSLEDSLGVVGTSALSRTVRPLTVQMFASSNLAGDTVRVTPDPGCGGGTGQVLAQTAPVVAGGGRAFTLVFGRAGAQAGSTESVRVATLPGSAPPGQSQIALFNAVPGTDSIALEVVQSGGDGVYQPLGSGVAYGSLSAWTSAPNVNSDATVRVVGQPQMSFALGQGRSALLVATGAWGDPGARLASLTN